MDRIYDFFNDMSGSFTIVKMLVPAFMAILFGQSGLDKVFHYKDNLAYFTDHFKNTPLSSGVKMLLPVITLLELKAAILCAIGTVSVATGNTKWAFWGLITAAVALLCLFFGQRVAKDYAGAVSLASYFILVVMGLLILT